MSPVYPLSSLTSSRESKTADHRSAMRSTASQYDGWATKFTVENLLVVTAIVGTIGQHDREHEPVRVLEHVSRELIKQGARDRSAPKPTEPHCHS